MLERERTLHQFVLHYCRRLVADLDDARLAELPAPGMNHPAWILGHLAIAVDFAGMLLGREKTCPESWFTLFGPGSKVIADRSAYPGKDELMRAIEAGHERLNQTIATASPDRLAAPQTAILGEFFPTVGDMVAHLMATHPCSHLGQLSAWRRLMGLPSVLGV